MLARLQVAQHQRSGRLPADDDRVSGLEMLQARGQRAVRHLDAEEFQVFVVVGAGDAVGARQRLAVDLEADHHELAVVKAQTGVARGPKLNRWSFQWRTSRTVSVPYLLMAFLLRRLGLA